MWLLLTVMTDFDKKWKIRRFFPDNRLIVIDQKGDGDVEVFVMKLPCLNRFLAFDDVLRGYSF